MTKYTTYKTPATRHFDKCPIHNFRQTKLNKWLGLALYRGGTKELIPIPATYGDKIYMCLEFASPHP